MARIELVGVSRRYATGGGTVTALDGVDVSVEAGARRGAWAIRERQDDVLNLVGALDLPTGGEVVIDGAPCVTRRGGSCSGTAGRP